MSDYIHRLGTNWGTHEAWPSVPFGMIRSWDTYSEWWKLEPARGSYDWSNLDWLLSQAELHHAQVLYTFGMTPRWASSAPNNGTCDLASEGAYGSCNPPLDMQDWDDFVRALATHYAGRIHYYELWNEPNLPAYWQGTLTQMLTMAQHAYTIIKGIDPNAVILTPATAGGYGAPYMASYLAAGGGKYADVVAFHGYQSTKEIRDAEKITGYVSLYRQAIAAAGLNKPLWDTEWSFEYTSNYPNTALQAAYLAKGYILRLSLGVKRSYWFAWDTPNWGGLWTSTGGITPAGIAYLQVYKWLVGASLSSRCTEDSKGTWRCGLSRAGGYQALIIWNSTSSFSYLPPTQYQYCAYLSGKIVALAGSSITVGNQPVLLETSKAF